MSAPVTPNEGPCPRRTFCRTCIGGMTVASAGAVAYPIVTFLGEPQRLGADRPLEVPLDQLAPGQAHYAEFRGQQIIVVVGEDGPEVFSASCPHLGCNVNWVTADHTFHCPCHGAVFDDEGEVMSGPVNAPLARLPFEIKDGVIVIA